MVYATRNIRYICGNLLRSARPPLQPGHPRPPIGNSQGKSLSVPRLVSIIFNHQSIPYFLIQFLYLKARIFAPLTNGVIRLLHSVSSFIHPKLVELVGEIEALEDAKPGKDNHQPVDDAIVEMDAVVEAADHEAE